MTSPESDILIVLSSLRAEGTPHMALAMCRVWQEQGIRPCIVDLGRAAPELRPNFDNLGVFVDSLPIERTGYARYPALARGVFQLCRKHRPKAVLCMPLGLHSFVAIGAKAAGVRRVCAHVGTPPNPAYMASRSGLKAQAIVQLGRPFTHRLICCSRFVQTRTVELFHMLHRETTMIYNGVDVERFAAAQLQRLERSSGSKWIIGMVATFENARDQDTLIRAAARLQSQGLKLEVRLIGDGTRRGVLEHLIQEYQAPVRLLGSRTDIPQQLAEMDIFAFSTSGLEGLGIALIEAMAASVPAIASDVPGCREVLDDGVLGNLVPPGDTDAWANSIVRITQDWESAKSMAAKAQQKVLRTFTADAMARAYLSALGVSPSSA